MQTNRPRPSSLKSNKSRFRPAGARLNRGKPFQQAPGFDFSAKNKLGQKGGGGISFNIKGGQGAKLKGKVTGVAFDKALPEDISNDNFPERIDGFDYPSANLMELTQAVSRLTGLNFIVDSGIKGKTVSIIAPSSITVAEVYKAFLSALAAHDFSIVKSGAFWKITSVDKALKENIEVYSGDYFPNTDQVITRIIKLKYINAKNFNDSIKWLLSHSKKGGGNKSHVYEETNSIILSDYGSVIERIMKIAQEIDIPGSEENIEIIPIEHSSAEELSGILQDLLSLESSSRKSKSFSSRSKSRGKPPKLSPLTQKKSFKGNMQISRIIPDIRTNSLVVSANKAGLSRIHELLKKLDTPVDVSRTGGVYVYHVLYGTAEEVHETLMGIKPAKKQGARYQMPQGSRGGDFSNRRYSRSYPSSKQGSSPLFEGVNIMPNKNTNSLIISAKNKYDYERVLAVLKKIDIPRDQVFIQAIIMEMIIDKADERQFNLGGMLKTLFKDTFKINKGDSGSFKDILGSSIAGFLSSGFDVTKLAEAGSFGPGLIFSLPISKLLEGDSSSGLGGEMTTFIDNEIKFDGEHGQKTPIEIQETREELRQKAMANWGNNANRRYSYIPLIRLLKKVDNVNILSTPQLTTLDNKEAHIEVGQDAPVGQRSVATGGGLVTNSQDRKDVSLKLTITPRINKESNTVHMKIEQKFDDFAPQSSTAANLQESAVHILKRNIKTEMILRDGETAVLGGLLTDKVSQGEAKVPILGDIPVLGWLFKGSNVQKEKRNLLVFIMPTIIPGSDRFKSKSLLQSKLNERLQFVKKHMKGRDPHGELLQDLIPEAKELIEDKSDKSSANLSQEDDFADELFSNKNEGAAALDSEGLGAVDSENLGAADSELGAADSELGAANIEGGLIEDEESDKDEFFAGESPSSQEDSSEEDESSFEEEESPSENENLFIETDSLNSESPLKEESDDSF